MKAIYSPLRTSIVFGLFCAIGFIPVNTLISSFFSWPLPFRLTIWFYLCLYSVLLSRWAGKSIGGVFFPLLIMFASIFMIPSQNLYLIFSLAVLSWIRSGLCFSGPLYKIIPVEIVICFGTGFLARSFSPGSLLTWSGIIWLFFLCQSVYFLFFENELKNRAEMSPKISPGIPSDPFEHARKQAEKILSEV